MPKHQTNTRGAAARAAILAGAAGLAALAPATAQAHFRLMYPPQWIVEGDTTGDPQKAGPCGVDSTVTYTPSNIVTNFAPGETIKMEWIETVAHDGWYRIALVQDRKDLKDPPYSTDAFGNSSDAAISNPPVAPILADDLFPHQAAGLATPKTYTYMLKLPDTPCEKCTLQVIQYMNGHFYNNPGGYFYHHCADISIHAGADGGTSVVGDAGKVRAGTGRDSGSTSSTTRDGATGTTGDDDSGDNPDPTGDDSGDDGGAGSSNNADGGGSNGGCSASGSQAPAAFGIAGLLAIAALWSRRRRTR